jgi:P27 family predicted phage terminase small subunit
MKGRKPKPTALKILEGNPGHRAKENLGRGEPDPEVMLGEPPVTIANDPVAVAYWYSEGGKLLKTRVITEMDLDAFARLCEYHARRTRQNQIVQKLEAKKRLSQAEATRLQMASNLLLKLDDRMHKIRVEFGMTPASRSRVKVDDGQGELDFNAGGSPLERAMAMSRVSA